MKNTEVAMDNVTSEVKREWVKVRYTPWMDRDIAEKQIQTLKERIAVLEKEVKRSGGSYK
jgi:hypothetical protein